MSKLSSYETIMLISLKNGDEAANTISEKFKNLISDNGTIDSVDEWGKRRLSYDINNESEALYVLVNFTAAPDFSAELDRVYKITDGIMRSLIIAK